MSYVSIHIVHSDGQVEGCCDDASNAHNFHVAIWQHLGKKHRAWPPSYHCVADRGPGRLDELWASIKTLPRDDGLVMAATFDRCWFPWKMRVEVADALHAARRYAPTAGHVAHILRGEVLGVDRGLRHRGFTFSSSLASSWSCRDTDGLHKIDKTGRRCEVCGKNDIDFAPDLIADA